VERDTHIPNRPHPKIAVAECPMCRGVVPADQLSFFGGRKLCRNCIAGWFEEDEADSDGKRDAS
jgi:hypothetical protein